MKIFAVVFVTTSCDADELSPCVGRLTEEKLDEFEKLLIREANNEEFDEDGSSLGEKIAEFLDNNETKLPATDLAAITSYYGSYITHDVSRYTLT